MRRVCDYVMHDGHSFHASLHPRRILPRSWARRSQGPCIHRNIARDIDGSVVLTHAEISISGPGR